MSGICCNNCDIGQLKSGGHVYCKSERKLMSITDLCEKFHNEEIQNRLLSEDVCHNLMNLFRHNFTSVNEAIMWLIQDHFTNR